MECKMCGHEQDIHIGGRLDCLEYVLRDGKRALCDCYCYIEPIRIESPKPDSEKPNG